MSAHEKKEMVKIAYYYYKKGLIQSDIAKKMSMSRQRVNRLLQKSIEENIVQITIVDFDKYNYELESKLEEKYNLTQCVVVSTIDEKSLIPELGSAGAEYLNRVLKKDDVLGVTWGRTLSEVAKKLKPDINLNVSVVQLIGGLNIAYSDLEPDDITRKIAEKLGGESYILYAPAIVENKETKEAIMSDHSLKRTFEKMEKCNYIIAGIGELKDDTTWYKDEKFNTQYKAHLLSKGCIGDIGFRWYDMNGRIVKQEYDDRTIGYNLLKKKNNALVIGIAGGRKKHEAILGALKGGYLDVLVTDSETADMLLKQ